MKLQILSDIHLEFGPFKIPKTDADVIILAGDISPGIEAVAWVKSQTTKPVLYVAGNHEYYGRKNSLPRLQDKIREACKGSNIHFLENDSIELNGVTFLGCTLWTDFNLHNNPKANMYDAQSMMTDYKMITVNIGGQWRKLKPEDTCLIHQTSKHWLAKEIFNRSSPVVVITHHAPSKQSIEAQQRESVLSAAYASNLDEFIITNQPDLWVHGHMHNSSDYKHGKTRVMCNPRGYEGYGLNENFIADLTVNIN